MQPIPLNLICVECEFDKSKHLLPCEYCSRLMCGHFARKVAMVISKWDGSDAIIVLRISCEKDVNVYGGIRYE